MKNNLVKVFSTSIFGNSLIKTQKNDTIVSVACSALHDLSNTISVIKGTIMLLQDKNSAHSEIIDVMNESLDNATKIIRSGMDYLVNLNDNNVFTLYSEILHTIKNFQKRLFKQGVLINIDVDSHIYIKSNPLIIDRIFTNLINNSLDAFADCKDGRSKRIVIKAYEFNSKITLEIEDNACGIAQEHIKKVFDSGYTTKNASSGMGLFLIRELIEKNLGGNIWINSKEGCYTKIKIILPNN